MRFKEQSIPGVRLIEAEPFKDDRGQFSRHFCQREYTKAGLETRIAQTNISQNWHKHTLRGFHYQVKPYEENKTIICMTGAIYDIIADLRPQSPTFLKWQSFNLKAGSLISLYIPAGCANAYLTLEDNTTVLYYMFEFYTAEAYRGFRYNDPAFDFKWPAKPAIISEKDRSYADLDIKALK